MLIAGTKFGPYEISGTIGAGGMGEVYRARDTRLGRDVALKVLPEAFARDAERMARLRREAQVLASLNHPNIAAIYGFEDSRATHALVMELVEGSTLADCIAQNAIPLDEALPIARQIAEALEYAHERGIIHRDLKPSNVKLTTEGNAKILDFGLAKALEGDPATTDVSNSPTLSALATRAGVLLGTAAYMAPEQAKGKPADRRADIWAFGVVLFEMLSGKRLFTGETTSDTLAEVLKMEPDWTLLPAATAPRIRELLQRCLKKDPRQRLQSIGDARIALEEVLSGAAGAEIPATQTNRRAGIRERIAWAVAAVLLIVAALFAAGYLLRTPAAMPAVVSEISPPPNVNFLAIGVSAGPPALSPDGKLLVFSGLSPGDRSHLWLRSMSSGVTQSLEGTQDAAYPFWSPDSRQIGFFANGKLERVSVSGGPPIRICNIYAGTNFSGSWGRDDTILFTARTNGPIFRVPASGGTLEPVTNVKPPLIFHRCPQFLPDGKHFIFFGGPTSAETSGTYVASLDGGEPKLLMRTSSDVLYTSSGNLLLVRDGVLMAQPFDQNKLEVSGDAVPLVAEAGAVASGSNRSLFSASNNGILVYRTGSETAGGNALLWFDRNGKQIAETGAPGRYGTVSVSPDGTKLVAATLEPNSIWVYDIARGTRTRVTFHASVNGQPSWSPDGKMIAFMSSRSGQYHLYQKAADGTGNAIPLVVDDATELYPSWSADGRYLVFERGGEQANARSELWALPLFGGGKAFPVIQSQFDVHWPTVSPDSRWVAYTSDESGQEEVYVAPFLHGSGKWLVSTNGGTRPRWRRDGRELFYLSLDSKMMSAGISEGPASVSVGEVRPLFQTNSAPTNGWLYDVSADGKKFLIVTEAAQKSSTPLTVVTNWPALLKKQ